MTSSIQIEQQLKKGMQLRALNQKKQALDLANSLYQSNPQNESIIGFFALMMLETGYANQAIKLLEHSIEQIGDRYTFYFDLAGIYKNFVDKEKSITYYKKAIDLNPKCTLSHFLIGKAYMKKNEPDNAIPYLEKSLKIDPNNPEAQHLLAIAKGSNLNTASKAYVTKVFDDFADSFEDTLLKNLNYSAPESICNQLKKYISKKDNTIIDLGCGTGLCGPLIKDICKTLKGVDLSQKMLDKASSKNIYHELAHEDICSYLKKQKHINAIIAADVFIYIGDLRDVFKSSYQALEYGGFFSFSIEKSSQETFKPLVSGRFAHSLNYIRDLASDNNFDWIENKEDILRKEAGIDTYGEIITLKKRSE